MNKTTKILLIIMAVSLVPLGMLGAMLYFGGTADSPVGGTIDLSKVTAEAGGGTYTGGSDSTTDGSISYGTVNSTTDGNISDAADADSTGMDVTQTTADNDYSSFYVSELPDSVWKNMTEKRTPSNSLLRLPMTGNVRVRKLHRFMFHNPILCWNVR